MSDKIETPYMEPVTYDYNKLRNDTTVPAMKAIYRVLAENVDLIVFNQEATPEKIEEDIGKVAELVLKVLLRNKVPDCDMQHVITITQETISAIFSKIGRQKRELEKEYLARTIGAKDPGTGKFSREYATFVDLFSALEKIRNEQDKEGNQYFIVK